MVLLPKPKVSLKYNLGLKVQCVGLAVYSSEVRRLQPTEASPVCQACWRATVAATKTQMTLSRASCCKSSVGHLEQSQCVECVYVGSEW